MKQQSDSSIWKSLAVAFGDGLAFGVGMKIAQGPPRTRQQSAEPAVEPPPAAAPAPAPVTPAPAEPFDLQMLSRVLASVDAKLARHMSEVEQRLASAEAQTEEKLGRRLRAYVDAHAEASEEALEERLRREISEAGDRTAKLLVDTIETRLLGRIAMLENELRALRASSSGSRDKLRGVLEGFSRACQEAMQELEESGGEGRAGTDDTGPAAGEEQPPSARLFTYQGRAERRLPIPLVSSIAVFVMGMVALGSAGWTF